MKALEAMIQEIDWRIEYEKKALDKAVEDFKEAASRYEAHQIVTFIPGKVEDIANHKARLENLEEQKMRLEFLKKQMGE